MKITFIDKPKPQVTSFTLFAKIDVDLLLKTKAITIIANRETKTRVNTEFKIGDHTSRINRKAEGFITYEKFSWNMLSNTQDISNYFVQSKKQGLTEYKKYVEAIVKNMLEPLHIDELTIYFINDAFEIN